MFSSDGLLVSANEAAEALFGHGLSLLARRRFFNNPLPEDALGALVERARLNEAPVREHRLVIDLPGQPMFESEAAAVPLPGGAVLLTLGRAPRRQGGDRATDQICARWPAWAAPWPTRSRTRSRASAARRSCSRRAPRPTTRRWPS